MKSRLQATAEINPESSEAAMPDLTARPPCPVYGRTRRARSGGQRRAV